MTTKKEIDFRLTQIRSRLQRLNKSNHSSSTISTRTNSTRIPANNKSQYEHFLTYLRRQSLARLRRKRQEQEGNTDHIETIVTLNLTKQPSFQSTSFHSFTSSVTDRSSITVQRANHQRQTAAHRLNPFQPKKSRNLVNEQINDSSIIITPRNSIVDELNATRRDYQPYEMHFNKDILNYCYTSEQSGMKYRGQILSTVV